MFRTIADFLRDWKSESAATLRVLEAIQPEALEQRAFEHGQTVRQLAWHLACAHTGVVGQAGLTGVEGPQFGDPIPTDFNDVVEAYRKSAASLAEQVEKEWDDAKLPEEVLMWGGMTFTYGSTLSGLLKHEIHHRAQIMTLMRLAGLRVPGIYGPSYEDTQERKAAAEVEA